MSYGALSLCQIDRIPVDRRMLSIYLSDTSHCDITYQSTRAVLTLTDLVECCHAKIW